LQSGQVSRLRAWSVFHPSRVNLAPAGAGRCSSESDAPIRAGDQPGGKSKVDSARNGETLDYDAETGALRLQLPGELLWRSLLKSSRS
jgi:hypothetical protein